jgi:transcriptional regulator with XRE-family HTH domain
MESTGQDTRDDGTAEDQLHLAEWRRRQSYSVRELARLTGLSRSTVSRLEVDRSPPRPSSVRKLATALGVSPAQLRRPPPSLE